MALVTGSGAARAQNATPPPDRLFGSVTIDGQNAPPGTAVAAFNGLSDCGTAIYDGTLYYLTINPAISTCAVEGTALSFRVDGRTAKESSRVSPLTGATIRRDLTVGSSPPPTRRPVSPLPTFAPTTPVLVPSVTSPTGAPTAQTRVPAPIPTTVAPMSPVAVTASAIPSAASTAAAAMRTASVAASRTPGASTTPSSTPTITPRATPRPGATPDVGPALSEIRRTVALAAGTVSETTRSGPSYSVTLNGSDRTLSSTLVVSVTDTRTGSSASGWHLTITSTTYTTGSVSLPTAATSITAASAGCAGACTLPANTTTYPKVVPASNPAPAAVPFFNATNGTGTQTLNVSATVALTLPATTLAGTYSSTFTIAIVTGP